MTPAFETGTPLTGTDLGNALGALLASGTAYLATLPDTTFFAAQGSAWSPAEHVRHLRKATTPLVTALRLPRWVLRLRFGRHHRGSRSFAEVREVYRAQLAQGAGAGRFTPSTEPPSGNPAARRAEIMTAWTAATVDLQNALRGWPEAALDRLRLPHPILGPLTVREMLAFTVYHTEHHLRRIAERAGDGQPGL
ncbi:MAG: DinB family protein [Gemmatimonadota bacterium]